MNYSDHSIIITLPPAAKVTCLCDKYQCVLRDGAGPVKRELLELQLVCQTTHPKLLELVRLLSGWRREGDRREKVRDVGGYSIM